MSVIITGTGSYIPEQVVKNTDFLDHEFYTAKGERILQDNEEIIDKFRKITGITERRYANPDQQTSDIATIAAQRALAESDTDPETLDGIIMAQNFGNIPSGTMQTDTVPNLAARVKYNLKIKNPDCIAFDILYGCPGWIQGVIVAEQYIKAGNGNRFLVIGAEMLSRVVDPHDRDSMIFSDGAAATLIEGSSDDRGILASVSQTYTYDEAYFLYFDHSLKQGYTPDTRYIRMLGPKIYEFALLNVPAAMKKCLDKAGVSIQDVKKVFIHQANEKMDHAILERFYSLYNITQLPDDIMPMSIHFLGNSSVATIPTLYDIVRKGGYPEHQLNKGDVILFASVGAGMSVNAIAYKY